MNLLTRIVIITIYVLKFGFLASGSNSSSQTGLLDRSQSHSTVAFEEQTNRRKSKLSKTKEMLEGENTQLKLGDTTTGPVHGENSSKDFMAPRPPTETLPPRPPTATLPPRPPTGTLPPSSSAPPVVGDAVRLSDSVSRTPSQPQSQTSAASTNTISEIRENSVEEQANLGDDETPDSELALSSSTKTKTLKTARQRHETRAAAAPEGRKKTEKKNLVKNMGEPEPSPAEETRSTEPNNTLEDEDLDLPPVFW